ncbi:MAG: DNA-directed RNA polymerase subunit delta [Solobacterium sp.]|jgi:DNA-directed RNA polymerase subunit delta|nr:DNA-directed RNA polymerase subunit delta [Solobacterium sp.]
MAYNLTMTDVAYNFLAKRKKEIEFAKLYQEVVKTMSISPEKQSRKKSQFYSELSLDNRFASLSGNKWDLRSRRKFDEVHIDTSDIELEDDIPEDEVEDVGLDLPRGEDAY